MSLSDAVVWNVSMIAQSFDVSAGGHVDFSGIFDESGWLVDIAGIYAGVPVVLSIEGTVAANEGTFTSTGIVENAIWTGSGSWSFIDVESNSVLMDFDVGATILAEDGTEKKPDQHAKKDKDGKPVRDVRIDFDSDPKNIVFRTGGIFVKTENGEPIEEIFIEDDVHRTPKLALGPATESIFHGESILTATADYGPGTISGTVTIVPEPAAFALVGIGLVGGACYCFARRSTSLRKKGPQKVVPNQKLLAGKCLQLRIW